MQKDIPLVPNRGPRQSHLTSARRDLIVIAVLIGSVAIFLFNSNSLIWTVATGRDEAFQDSVRVISVALTLNVALILFSWRRYVDLQHEAELCNDGERRAALLASTDAITGLLNRKGFADGVQTLAAQASPGGHSLVILSLQMQRFKTINDRHGYDIGDALLKRIAGALTAEVPIGAATARLSGDEFAVALLIASEKL